jgi:hypothetical protein
MLKPLLVAVLLTGLFTPIASAAPAATCLEPPTADKNELCVELVNDGKGVSAVGEFVPADSQVPATLKVKVQFQFIWPPTPFTLATKTVTGVGRLQAATDSTELPIDAYRVRACADGSTEISSRLYQVCTAWLQL